MTWYGRHRLQGADDCPFYGEPFAHCYVCGHELCLFWHDEYWCDQCQDNSLPGVPRGTKCSVCGWEPDTEEGDEPLVRGLCPYHQPQPTGPFPDWGVRPDCECTRVTGLCSNRHELVCLCACHAPGACGYCGIQRDNHAANCPKGATGAGHVAAFLAWAGGRNGETQ